MLQPGKQLTIFWEVITLFYVADTLGEVVFAGVSPPWHATIYFEHLMLCEGQFYHMEFFFNSSPITDDCILI